ncbi:MAG TPA: peptide-methionine (S)-S-oxide reductase, partial [Microbacterium ginsengisoli]|nr:peptide-methionine (S)-S-oxide reductase [Microbacterium ginsengisoli]
YEQVCTGATGHAEAVAVTFDPDVVPADVILDAFFTMHDPRQL